MLDNDKIAKLKKEDTAKVLLLQRELVQTKAQLLHCTDVLTRSGITYKNVITYFNPPTDDERLGMRLALEFAGGMTVRDISEYHKINPSKVSQILHGAGSFDRTERDKRVLILYESGLSTRGIQRACHVSPKKLYEIIRAAGIYKPRPTRQKKA
jgi:hypothetical protein